MTASANDYTVVFAQGTNPNVRANVVIVAGAGLRHNYFGMDAAAVTVLNTSVLETLKRSAGVVRVVPDFTTRQRVAKEVPSPPTPL